MNSVICTLFENHYHYGVAALTNSLHRHGFKGPIYAGYRGSLPEWANQAKEDTSLTWPGSRTIQISNEINLHFLPLNTEFHLTNFKPNFMLQLWEGPAKSAEAIAYFDPDIVVKCKWDFFENWMLYGVALVHEITANDMPPTHPLRKAWGGVICKAGKRPMRELHSYINGGFCGVSKKYIEFLKSWIEIFETGIKHFNLSAEQWGHGFDRTYIFYAQDQDALNITAMCSESPLSEIGPEGMDFIPGGWTMSHALGYLKPWKKNFLLSVLKGNPPTLADRSYWENVEGPLKIHNSFYIQIKIFSLKAAAFFSRFYRRS